MKEIYSTAIRLLTYSLSMACLLSGCKKQEPVYEFDKVAILDDVVQQEVLPGLTLLINGTDSLRSAVNNFVQQLDAQSLSSARAQFIVTDLRWKACELYDVGLVQDRHLHSRISKWPTDPSLIENAITRGDTMDEAYFEALGATSRGLPAIEYLLFHLDASATLAQYTTDTLAAIRRDFLLGLSRNLHQKSVELQHTWSPQGENFASEFVHSTATGTSDPLSELVNAMISLLEEVTKVKIGKPLGKFDLGILQVELVESSDANISLPLLRANVVALQSAYLGTPDTGLDFALDALHAQYGEAALSTAIAQRFATALTAIDQITIPLQDALLTQHDQVEAAYQACKDLVVLFKADLSSSMSIVVTVTDNDGD